MSAKNERQNRIKEILTDRNITSQEALADILQNEGIYATQATLSRDFAELGVIRIGGPGGIRYVLDPNESGKKIRELIGFEIMSIEHNESLIVIRTLAGRAQGIGHYIDRMNKKEILGTVAGDDTVLVVPNSIKNIPVVCRIIKSIMSDTHSNTEKINT